MAYNLNEVAMITGLTTRTLRNYLKINLLKGEKVDGNWSFTEEELDEFLSRPAVKQAVAAKRNAVVYDFLSDPFKKGNRICTIMDLPVSELRFLLRDDQQKRKRYRLPFQHGTGLCPLYPVRIRRYGNQPDESLL